MTMFNLSDQALLWICQLKARRTKNCDRQYWRVKVMEDPSPNNFVSHMIFFKCYSTSECGDKPDQFCDQHRHIASLHHQGPSRASPQVGSCQLLVGPLHRFITNLQLRQELFTRECANIQYIIYIRGNFFRFLHQSLRIAFIVSMPLRAMQYHTRSYNINTIPYHTKSCNTISCNTTQCYTL